MKKVLMFALWYITAMAVTTFALNLISAPNTIENLIGVAVLIAAIAISFKTSCFTKIKLGKND